MATQPVNFTRTVACPQCKGGGQITVTVEGCESGTFKMPCMTCKGSGRISLRAAQAYKEEMEAWCHCGHDGSDPIFKADGACGCGINKHHCHCSNCGKVQQIG